MASQCCIFLLLNNHSFWMQQLTQASSTTSHRWKHCFVIPVAMLSRGMLHIMWTFQHICSFSFIPYYQSIFLGFRDCLVSLCVMYLKKKSRKGKGEVQFQVCSLVSLWVTLVFDFRQSNIYFCASGVYKVAIPSHFSCGRWAAVHNLGISPYKKNTV